MYLPVLGSDPMSSVFLGKCVTHLSTFVCLSWNTPILMNISLWGAGRIGPVPNRSSEIGPLKKSSLGKSAP